MERTSFCGRFEDLEALDRLIGEPERLVTITGPAGAGKTRLALRWASAHARDARVFVVELASARSIDDVSAAVGNAVGPIARATGIDALPAPERAAGVLEGVGDAIVVLDSFDHLIGCAEATVGLWLSLLPRIRFVVTSREALAIAGELRYELGPLDEEAAIALFDSRARAIAPSYRTTDPTRAIVRSIVDRLDRLPLAIELAAARVAVLGPSDILARLGEALDLLGDSRASLRGALDASWAILSAPERDALAAFSVFTGGFSVDAAAHVMGSESADRVALDCIDALRRKSLVRIVSAPDDEALRFDLLQTIRAYAAERLAEGGRGADVERRHAAFFLAHAGTCLAALNGSGEVAALRELRVELPNLVAAWHASLARDASASVRLGLAIAKVSALSGPFALCLDLLDTSIDVARREERARPWLAALLVARGDARAVAGQRTEAECDLEEAAEVAHAAGDTAVESDALRLQGVLARDEGDFDRARTLLESAVALLDAATEPTLRAQLGSTARNLATLYRQQGRRSAARASYERALSLARETDDHRSEGLCLAGLGHLYYALRDEAHARSSYDEALPKLAAAGDRRTEGVVLDRQAVIALGEGDAPRALALLETALTHLRSVGDQRLEAIALAHRGAALAAADRVDEAAASFDAAARFIERSGHGSLPVALATLRRSVDVALARAARAAGDHGRERALLPRTAPSLPASEDEDIEIAHRLLAAAVRGMRARGARSSKGEQAQANANANANATEPMLEVGPAGTWFQVGKGRRVDLARAPALGSLLAVLAEQRIDKPGEPLTADAIAERASQSAARDLRTSIARVYVNVAKLRRRGLEGILVQQSGGYLLHPAVSCVVRDDE